MPLCGAVTKLTGPSPDADGCTLRAPVAAADAHPHRLRDLRRRWEGKNREKARPTTELGDADVRRRRPRLFHGTKGIAGERGRGMRKRKRSARVAERRQRLAVGTGMGGRASVITSLRPPHQGLVGRSVGRLVLCVAPMHIFPNIERASRRSYGGIFFQSLCAHERDVLVINDTGGGLLIGTFASGSLMGNILSRAGHPP